MGGEQAGCDIDRDGDHANVATGCEARASAVGRGPWWAPAVRMSTAEIRAVYSMAGTQEATCKPCLVHSKSVISTMQRGLSNRQQQTASQEQSSSASMSCVGRPFAPSPTAA